MKKRLKNNRPLSERDLKISRQMFILESMTGTTGFSLVGGAFIAGFADLLGASVAVIGIIGGLPIFAAVIQLVSPFIFENMLRRKKAVIIGMIISRLALSLVFLVPLLFSSFNMKIITFSILITVGYFGMHIVLPPLFCWIVSVVNKEKIGSFIGAKEALSYLTLGFFSVIMGFSLDYYRANNIELYGFILAAIIIFVLSIVNVSSLFIAREPNVNECSNRISASDIFKKPFLNIKFRRVIVLNILWNSGYWIAAPFFYAFMVSGLRLPFIFILGTGFLTNIARVLMSKRWGRLADKIGSEIVIKLGFINMCVAHLLWIFVNAGNAYWVISIIMILTGIGFGAVSISMFNLQYFYSPVENRTIYLSSNGAFGGGCGFLSTILGSILLGILGTNSINLLGNNLGGMQVIFFISVILLASAAGYVHKYIKKE